MTDAAAELSALREDIAALAARARSLGLSLETLASLAAALGAPRLRSRSHCGIDRRVFAGDVSASIRLPASLLCSPLSERTCTSS